MLNDRDISVVIPILGFIIFLILNIENELIIKILNRFDQFF